MRIAEEEQALEDAEEQEAEQRELQQMEVVEEEEEEEERELKGDEKEGDEEGETSDTVGHTRHTHTHQFCQLDATLLDCMRFSVYH